VLGFVQAWSNRYFIDPDGISYLDVADKYLQADWNGAVNTYFSPLYSWLFAAALYVFRPSPHWEYPVVHLVNFLVYLVSFASFQFLLSQVISFAEEARNPESESLLPRWAWQAIGCVLFIWNSLFLITLSITTPDTCVAAMVFLLGGLLIRIRRRPAAWSSYLYFGLALGVAYLAKAVMFPLAFVFLAIAFCCSGSAWRILLPRVLMSCLLFLLVAAPFILAIHHFRNRWTFSDTGRIAYGWLIDNTDPYTHWQGDPAGSGQPAHPTRRVFDSPPVYEFKEPFAVTYPPWYDPSYWYAGAVNHISVSGHVRAFGDGLLQYYAVFINSPIGMSILVSFLILAFYRRPAPWEWIARVGLWNVLFPAIAAFALYSLIHVEKRYIGPFVVLFWLALFSSVRFAKNDQSRKLVSAVFVGLLVSTMTVIIAKSLAPTFITLREIIKREETVSTAHWQIADGLQRLGFQPGDPIGSIGYGFGGIEYSARLAKLRIVAEITTGTDIKPKEDVDKFWHSNPETQGKAIAAFANAGAKAIVANRLPQGLAEAPGWQRVGATDAYVYFLR
jgi:hypothetical protein